MATEIFTPLKGYFACNTITYEVYAPFLCTKCCHCTWCQRETGSAFVLNAIIETSHFRITSETKPILIDTPSASGDGQTIARCPNCYVALYSDYGGDGTWTTFVRVGTLDDEGKKTIKPDAHIFTSTKMGWVDLVSEQERGVLVTDGACRMSQVWGEDAQKRFNVLKQQMDGAKTAEEAPVKGNESRET